MFHELYVRWAQFGVFCPMMRSHGADAPREIFLYGKAGEPVYDALVDAIKLRYSLMPYIYSTSWEVSHRNSTFMRALFMDFLSDPKTWNMGSEYMFGSSFLVAPVLHAQYTPEQAQQILKENEGWGCKAQESDIPLLSVDFTQSKEMELYLPAGSQWYDFLDERSGRRWAEAEGDDCVQSYSALCTCWKHRAVRSRCAIRDREEMGQSQGLCLSWCRW